MQPCAENLPIRSLRSTVAAVRAVVLLALAAGPSVCAQTDAGSSQVLQQRYESAQKALAAGKVELAHDEYSTFLVQALQRIATRQVAAGDLERAIAIYQEALEVAPNDLRLSLEYVQVCVQANALAKARATAERSAVQSPRDARAHHEFGLVLSRLNEDDAALREFEKAVALDPDFANGYALAIHHLKLKDREGAALVFREILKGLGDSAEIHMAFGRAYAEAGCPEQGIEEFKQALAKDPKIAGAHYSLGASYLIGLGDAALSDAEREFELELKAHPDDFYALSQLGNVKLSQHEPAEAERLLSRASSLQPHNPDVFLSLGQGYLDLGRNGDAEAALRKSIGLTRDESRNHFQVQRTHYLLGRLLLQSGKQKDAVEELKISDRLLRLSVAQNQGVPATEISNDAANSVRLPDPKAVSDADPEVSTQLQEFEGRVSPAIADSYNNLGVMAAGGNDFSTALRHFERAAHWNPELEGLDLNWGKAAFSAKDYAEAIPPLERRVNKTPWDDWARAALGSSYFSLNNYASTIQTLQPMGPNLTKSPQLNFMYAVSLVKAGDFDNGVQRLEELQKANPAIAAIPAALAEAFASHGNNTRAGVAYLELGRLQLRSGDRKAAIASLETAVKLDPANSEAQRVLSEARTK